MQDRSIDQGEELTEMNFAKEGKSAQPIFISTSLSLEHKKAVFKWLKWYEDLFAWTYAERPRFDS